MSKLKVKASGWTTRRCARLRPWERTQWLQSRRAGIWSCKWCCFHCWRAKLPTPTGLISLLAIMAPVNPSGCSRGGASRRIHLLIASATAAVKPGAHAAQVLERAHLSRIDCGGATSGSVPRPRTSCSWVISCKLIKANVVGFRFWCPKGPWSNEISLALQACWKLFHSSFLHIEKCWCSDVPARPFGCGIPLDLVAVHNDMLFWLVLACSFGRTSSQRMYISINLSHKIESLVTNYACCGVSDGKPYGWSSVRRTGGPSSFWNLSALAVLHGGPPSSAQWEQKCKSCLIQCIGSRWSFQVNAHHLSVLIG